MTNAIEAFERVKQSLESIDTSGLQVFPEAASYGDYWPQGDIYVELLEALPPVGPLTDERHLAPGTTQGSRHVLEGDAIVYDRDGELDGPVIEVKTEAVITHPEHGDLQLPPGIYGITYQRAYADELRRVLD